MAEKTKAEIESEKLISDAKKQAATIIESSKNPTIVEAQKIAESIISVANSEAKTKIEIADGRAKDLISKAKKESKSFDGVSSFRKDLIGKLCHSAGSFDGIPSAIASKILATADAIIDSLKEGK